MSVIDDYLKNISQSEKEALNKVRSIVLKMVPDAEETIGYGMPVMKYNNKYLIGFAAFKDHMSLFPGSGPTEALKDKLTSYKLSKGTIQFTIENPIPDSLVKEIIQLCLDRI